MFRLLIGTLLMIGLVFVFGIAATPKSSWHAADVPPTASEQQAKPETASPKAPSAHSTTPSGFCCCGRATRFRCRFGFPIN